MEHAKFIKFSFSFEAEVKEQCYQIKYKVKSNMQHMHGHTHTHTPTLHAESENIFTPTLNSMSLHLSLSKIPSWPLTGLNPLSNSHRNNSVTAVLQNGLRAKKRIRTLTFQLASQTNA